MKLSLSGFLFEDNYVTNSLSFFDFVQLAVKAGYKGVELRKTQVSLDTPRRLLSEYRDILDDKGLRVTCMTPRGMPAEEPARREFFARYLDIAEFMGCEMLKINASSQWMYYAAGKALERNIIVGTNTHIKSPTETVYGTEKLISEVNHGNFAIFYDSMHLAIAGEDYMGAIDRFFPQMCNVLVQCVCMPESDESPVISYGGKNYIKTRIDENPIQDWPGILKKLKMLDYKGWITVIENGWPLEKRQAVAIKTLEYIKSIEC